MEKTSKIIKVTEKDRTNKDTGDKVYYSTVLMENTDEYPISKGKKVSGAFKEGQMLTYTIEKVGEYDKIVVKEDKPAFGAKPGFSKNYEKDAVTMCMSYAKDLVVAGKIDVKDMNSQAESMYKWVLGTLITAK